MVSMLSLFAAVAMNLQVAPAPPRVPRHVPRKSGISADGCVSTGPLVQAVSSSERATRTRVIGRHDTRRGRGLRDWNH